MGGRFVRIENITIENFKNVKYGTLDLTNRKKIIVQVLWGCMDKMVQGKLR